MENQEFKDTRLKILHTSWKLAKDGNKACNNGK